MEELSGHVNRAHSAVLEDFKVDALYFQLLKKTVGNILKHSDLI
jgi:hypothetical protein